MSSDIDDELPSGFSIASSALSQGALVDIDILPTHVGALADLDAFMRSRGYEHLVVSPSEPLSIVGNGINAYVGSTSQMILNASTDTVVFNNSRSSPSPAFVLNTSSGVITSNANVSWAQIRYSIGCTSENGRITSSAFLAINGTEVPGSRSYNYHRSDTDGFNTATMSVEAPLSSTDTIEVMVEVTDGNDDIEMLPNASSLSVTILQA